MIRGDAIFPISGRPEPLAGAAGDESGEPFAIETATAIISGSAASGLGLGSRSCLQWANYVLRRSGRKPKARKTLGTNPIFPAPL
jgi:hypothetical protein